VYSLTFTEVSEADGVLKGRYDGWTTMAFEGRLEKSGLSWRILPSKRHKWDGYSGYASLTDQNRLEGSFQGKNDRWKILIELY